MLQNYKPWGKQTGGGAPRVNYKINKSKLVANSIEKNILQFLGDRKWNKRHTTSKNGI